MLQVIHFKEYLKKREQIRLKVLELGSLIWMYGVVLSHSMPNAMIFN